MSSAKPVTAAPIGKPKRKKQWTRVGIPPHLCIVCGDGAYGYNFGQITCESCKAFFRRHINKPRNYVCPGDRQCNVSCKTRKYCPACRLRKCFDVGLKPDIARITNQLREEKREARKTKHQTAQRSCSTSDSESQVKTRVCKRTFKETGEQSTSDQTVKPKLRTRRKTCSAETPRAVSPSDSECQVKTRVCKLTFKETGEQSTSDQTVKPKLRTRRKTCAAETPRAVSPSRSGQQGRSESPQVDARSASVSPPLLTSPVVNATCDTPASTQCLSVSIPSCASLFPLSAEALSPDTQVDEKANAVAGDVTKPTGQVSGDGNQTSPCSTLSRKNYTTTTNYSNQSSSYSDPLAASNLTVPSEYQQKQPVMNAILPPPAVLSKYVLDDADFSYLRMVCNKLLMTMQTPFTNNEISFLGSKMLPETMSELLAIAETSMRRFVRFTKQFEDFRNNFSFDEKVSMLRRAVLTCHIFTFSFGFDVEKRVRVIPLVDGTERVLTGAHIAELKRRAGLPEHNDPRPAYIRVHSDIRARFPRTWRMLVAAFSLVALFTPKFQMRKAAKSVTNTTKADSLGHSKSNLSCLNLENGVPAKQSVSSDVNTSPSTVDEPDEPDEAAVQLAAKMRPFYQRYKAFVPRYIEYAERVCLSEDERRTLVRLCKTFIDDAHEIATNITNRVGFMATFDPGALSLIPLYNELIDS